ncbi:MAG: tetratricopeptide repeat protein [Planctomycetaceae bacterium]|nr:tetratricopeptide repeat protein [Planctomycetaceae bacterium]
MPRHLGTLRRPAIIGLGLTLTAFAAWAAADWYRTVPNDALQHARYVGRDACIGCHQTEYELWKGSDHDRAMELATDETVLGNFNNAVFTRFDETTKFFRDGKKFMVNAEGPDGQYHDYEIKYTFGVRPLQQYMVEFPDGRVQVLRVSWDVEKKEWFYVAPTDAAEERIEANDPLHWTGLAQNWNTMCAECHSTDYHKNYDLATNAYKSDFFEIDVSCEACHGPGSLHVELANRRGLFWDRNVHYGLTNEMKGAANSRQVETCAPCHSRRSIIHPDYRPGDSFLDAFQPLLLDAGLYHDDGQILDEVYEYGSFTQSKMYHKGVRCTDCHDPHSLKLKYEGNRLCAQCHEPGKYDGAGHNHHPNATPGSPETQCVTCHMPHTTYMGIDERRDHSIRVPRPDLTAKYGTPNVCSRCHTKPHESAQWAADRIVQWYGPKRPDDPHYAEAFALARKGEPAGFELLKEAIERTENSEIVRATAIELLQHYPTVESARLRREALSDPSPLVRASAVRSFAADLSAADDVSAKLVQEIAPKLEDRSRAVRLAAANRLVADADDLAASPYGAALKEAVKEFRDGQSIQLDRAQSNRNLGNLALQLGDPLGAVESLRTAIRIEPYLTGPRTELSQLLDQLAADPAQAETADKAQATPEEIRKLREEEADLLARDAKLLPTDANVRYMRGRLLYLLDRPDEARQAFIEACELAPNEYDYWLWLALICEKQQRWEQAVMALQRMAQLRPEAQDWKGIFLRVRQAVEAAGGTINVQKQPAAGEDAEPEPPTGPDAASTASPSATEAAPPSAAATETPPAS